MAWQIGCCPDVDALVQEVLRPWGVLWRAKELDGLSEEYLDLVGLACRCWDASFLVQNHKGITDLVSETAAFEAARDQLLVAYRRLRTASGTN